VFGKRGDTLSNPSQAWSRRRRFRSLLTNQQGITLVEVVISVALLTVGLLGVGAALLAQTGGVAAGMTSGQAAVTRAHYLSTATLLAQDRLEQIKRLQYTIGPPVVDQITAPTPAGFEDEAFGTMTEYPAFSRQVRVVSATPSANTKTVTVTVQFRLPTATGRNDESVAVSTVIAAR
jgi:hypothetical protein